MQYDFAPGATSKKVRIRILKDDGKANTALVHSDLTAWYARDGGDDTEFELSALATPGSAWSSGAIVHDRDGWYVLCVPDAALAAGAQNVDFGFEEDTDINPEACGASLGVNVSHVNGTAQTARDLGANIDTPVSTRMPQPRYR